ncbi:mannosyl-3-phosphoglycerate phosphatase [Chloroflexota bacterium]
MRMQPKRVVFTDLDGTLLDFATYSYAKALEALRQLQEKEIPIIFCSSKTRAEQEIYRQKLNINDPFIVENGGAIFIPRDYFPFDFDHTKITEDYFVIELGIPYNRIREKLKKVESEPGLELKGFGDLSAEEVAEDSGLSLPFAALAKQREYAETFIIPDSKEDKKTVLQKIEETGLNWTHGGRYYNAMAGSDKGKAVNILSKLFRNKFGEIETIGIGDSQNDLPMLAAVDIPVLVQKPGNRWEEVNSTSIHRTEGVGPEGWSAAIRKLFGTKI